MHLCTGCQSVDWDARILKDQEHARRGGKLKAFCPHCTHLDGTRVRLLHSAHSLCEVCAKARNECQACGRSTLSGEETAAAEAFARLADHYTVIVKLRGVSSPTAAAFREMQSDDVRTELKRLTVGDLDKRVPERPLMAKLFGPRRLPDLVRLHCDDCAEEPPSPAFGQGINCGHFVFAAHQAWCLHCALEKKRCSTCGATTR